MGSLIEAHQPATKFQYAMCSDIAKSDLFRFSVNDTLLILSELRKVIKMDHKDTMSQYKGLQYFYDNGPPVDECGFSDSVLNIVFHIRRGDVSATHRGHSGLMSYFLVFAKRISQVLRGSDLQYRIIVYSEANTTQFTKERTSNTIHYDSFSVKLNAFKSIRFAKEPVGLPPDGQRHMYHGAFRDKSGTYHSMMFSLEDNPWIVLKCMARSDIFIGSSSSYSTISALLAKGVRILPKSTFVADQCKGFGKFCAQQLTQAKDFLKWNASRFMRLFSALRESSNESKGM